MINIEVLMSNEGARTAQAEIRSFLAHENRKMAGEIADRGNAAQGYVMLRQILEKITAQVGRQDREESERRRAEREANTPTVREQWRRV